MARFPYVDEINYDRELFHPQAAKERYQTKKTSYKLLCIACIYSLKMHENNYYMIKTR